MLCAVARGPGMCWNQRDTEAMTPNDLSSYPSQRDPGCYWARHTKLSPGIYNMGLVIPEDLTPSSDPLGQEAHIWCTCIYAGKHSYRSHKIKYNLKIIKDGFRVLLSRDNRMHNWAGWMAQRLGALAALLEDSGFDSHITL